MPDIKELKKVDVKFRLEIAEIRNYTLEMENNFKNNLLDRIWKKFSLII